MLGKNRKRQGRGRKAVRGESEEEGDELDESSDESSDEDQKRKKPARREVRTKKVRFERGTDLKDEVEELTTKLHGLNMQEAAYASTYARLVLVAPVLADKIPPPARWTAGATVTAAMGTPSHTH
ncbi:hypothetical protein BYT27DRAFT_7109957, partial [Phlegmacium glaucopus]